MSVSVIISTHNRPKFLRLTLTSILKQKVLPDEIILIDDGSTVPLVVADLIDSIRYMGVEVRFFRFNEEVGLGAARYFGAYKSKYEYLVFIDDDAVADSSLIEAYVNRFKEGGCDIIAGVCLPLYLKSFKLPSWWDENVLGPLVAVRNDVILKSKKSKPQDYVYGCNFAIHRDVLKVVKGFKPWLGRVRGILLSGEEWDLAARAYHKGLKICLEKKAVVYHVITPNKIILKRIIDLGVTTAMVRALLLYEGTIQKPPVSYLTGCYLILPKDVIEFLYYTLRRRFQNSIKKIHELIVHFLIPFYYKRCLKLRNVR